MNNHYKLQIKKDIEELKNNLSQIETNISKYPLLIQLEIIKRLKSNILDFLELSKNEYDESKNTDTVHGFTK
jgi:hypothetical protein